MQVFNGLGVVRLQFDNLTEVLRRAAVVSQLAVQQAPGQERVGGFFIFGFKTLIQSRQGWQNPLAAQLVQRLEAIVVSVAPIFFTAYVMFSVHGVSYGAVCSSLCQVAGQAFQPFIGKDMQRPVGSHQAVCLQVTCSPLGRIVKLC